MLVSVEYHQVVVAVIAAFGLASNPRYNSPYSLCGTAAAVFRMARL